MNSQLRSGWSGRAGRTGSVTSRAVFNASRRPTFWLPCLHATCRPPGLKSTTTSNCRRSFWRS